MPPDAIGLPGTRYLYRDRVRIVAGRFGAEHARKFQPGDGSILPEHRAQRVVAVSGNAHDGISSASSCSIWGRPPWRVSLSSPIVGRTPGFTISSDCTISCKHTVTRRGTGAGTSRISNTPGGNASPPQPSSKGYTASPARLFRRRGGERPQPRVSRSRPIRSRGSACENRLSRAAHASVPPLLFVNSRCLHVLRARCLRALRSALLD
jgi:hypothetical protein